MRACVRAGPQAQGRAHFEQEHGCHGVLPAASPGFLSSRMRGCGWAGPGKGSDRPKLASLLLQRGRPLSGSEG